MTIEYFTEAEIKKLNDLYRTEPILNPEFNIQAEGRGLGDIIKKFAEDINAVIGSTISLPPTSQDEIRRISFFFSGG